MPALSPTPTAWMSSIAVMPVSMRATAQALGGASPEETPEAQPPAHSTISRSSRRMIVLPFPPAV